MLAPHVPRREEPAAWAEVRRARAAASCCLRGGVDDDGSTGCSVGPPLASAHARRTSRDPHRTRRPQGQRHPRADARTRRRARRGAQRRGLVPRPAAEPRASTR